jgi:glycosyltransferase involved in cell wall biosynthesis
MIYLNPENASALGDDTFWTWFKREFPSSKFGTPKRLNADDIVLQYSTLGFPNVAGKSLAVLWELYPEMKVVFQSSEWDHILRKVYEAAKLCTYRTVPTVGSIRYYEEIGSVDILPIGVDTDLFKPAADKEKVREKYGIPLDGEVGFWGGTTHAMKGSTRLFEYAKQHPEINWVCVWKWKQEEGKLPGAHNFTQVNQKTLSELMGCCDFALFTGRLSSYFMIEWEAMSCGLPVRFNDDIVFPRDFMPSLNPRDDVFRFKWDRKSAKALWAHHLEERGVTW